MNTTTGSVDEIWARAAADAGSAEASGPHVRRIVERIVASLSDGAFDRSTRDAAFGQLHHRLVGHLRYVAERTVGGADAERVEAPIIVIGPARAGTSIAHELLALDPDARGVRMWEIDEPAPLPGRGVDSDRLARTTKRLREWTDRTPGILSMHPYFDDGGMSLLEDDAVVVLELRGSQPMFDYAIPFPLIDADADVPAPAEFYAAHRRILQYLQLGAPSRHWALKGTFHTDKTSVIRQVYPDARFVWCHRDPVKVFPSIMQIMAVVQGDPNLEQLNIAAFAPMILQMFGDPILRAMDDPCSNDDGVFHLHFSRLTADHAGTIAALYDHFGMQFTPEHRRRVDAWIADPANDPNRHGRIQVTPEHFGLTASQIDEAFGDYVQRYGIERERS